MGVVSEERLNILERFGDSDSQDLIADIKYLREELKWAYLFILGDDMDEVQEQAEYRCFNGLKEL